MYRKAPEKKTPEEKLFEAPREMIATGAKTFKKIIGKEPVQKEFFGIGKPSPKKMLLQTKAEQALVGLADIGLGLIEPVFIPFEKTGVYIAEKTGAKMPEIKGRLGETTLFEVGGTKKKTAEFIGGLFAFVGAPIAISKTLRFGAAKLGARAKVKQFGRVSTSIDDVSLTSGKFYGKGTISKPLFGTKKFTLAESSAIQTSKLKTPVIEPYERAVATVQTGAEPRINILEIPKQHKKFFELKTGRGLKAGARAEKGKRLLQERAGFTTVFEPVSLEVKAADFGEFGLVSQKTAGTGTIAGRFESFKLGKPAGKGFAKKKPVEGLFGGRKAYDQKAILLTREGEYIGLAKQKTKALVKVEAPGLKTKVKADIETVAAVAGKTVKKDKPFTQFYGWAQKTKTGTVQKLGVLGKEIRIAEEGALAKTAKEAALFEKTALKKAGKAAAKTRTALKTGLVAGTVFGTGTRQKKASVTPLLDSAITSLSKAKEKQKLVFGTAFDPLAIQKEKTKPGVVSITGFGLFEGVAEQEKEKTLAGLLAITTAKPLEKTTGKTIPFLDFAPIPITNIPVIPIIPIPPLPKARRKARAPGFAGTKQQGWNPFVKSKGKWL